MYINFTVSNTTNRRTIDVSCAINYNIKKLNYVTYQTQKKLNKNWWKSLILQEVYVKR